MINAFDWGAYGVLRVTAMLEGGGPPIVGYLKGDRTRTEIPLPKRAEGSLIADGWKQQLSNAQLADGDDSDALPEGDGHAGDGLTLYEEYRGFIENGKHIHGEPGIKDYFVFNDVGAKAAQAIQLFETVTGLAVHGQLLRNEFPSTRIMNANRFEAPHLVDQHACG